MSRAGGAGRIALVTGGARGIGKAIADRLVGDGMHVIIADLDLAAAERAAQECNGAGSAVQLDVSNFEDVKRLVDGFEADGVGINVLINNAGVLDNVSLADAQPALFDRVIGVNLKGPFFLSQQVVRVMPSDGRSSIVSIASGSAILGNQNRPVYGPAKAAVMALTRSLAVELAGRRIRANAIAPGAVETEMTKNDHTPDVRRKIIGRTPLARYGRPEEIAAVVSFLTSDDASYITGQTIAVDGGFSSAGFFDSAQE